APDSDAAPDAGDTVPTAATRPVPRMANPLDVDWTACARIGAVGVTGLAALLASSFVEDTSANVWLLATMLAWIDLSLALAVWAWSARSRDVGAVAALTLVPAILAGIGRLHPTDYQAYAVPTGVYLIAIGAAVRRDPRPGHSVAANIIAAV